MTNEDTASDFEAFRAAFPLLREAAWLASPSTAPAAKPVVEAVTTALGEWAQGIGTWRTRDVAVEATRHAVAALLGVPSRNVAVMQSVAQAASTVAASLPPGSRVVVGEQEYRSNLFPWLAAERTGVTVTLVPMPGMVLYTEALLEAVTSGTTLVSLSTVQSASGSRADLTAVAARCREVGAQLFLDATQSTGVLRLPADLAPDYVATHGYKWLLSPRGAAWLHVRDERLGTINPLAPSHRSADDPWDHYYGGPLECSQGASKLDMSLGFLAWAGASAGLDLLRDLDEAAVEKRCLHLAALAREGLEDLGLSCSPSDLPSHIVTFRPPDPDTISKALESAAVHVTARAEMVRLGFHAFNNEDDVSRTLDAVRRATP